VLTLLCSLPDIMTRMMYPSLSQFQWQWSHQVTLQQAEAFVKVEDSTSYIVYHLFPFQSVDQPQSVLLLIIVSNMVIL